MKRRIVETEDGSTTIYLPEMDEHYHSSHGAVQEALHVFIENGFKHVELNNISIFELGLGTGLNAFLTLKTAKEKGVKINYTGLEAFPVSPEHVEAMNYVENIDSSLSDFYNRLHTCDWGVTIAITDYFSLLKVHEKIQEYKPEPEAIDLVYFDAFGFRAQEEMWSVSVLSKMHSMLKKGGILVTYAARGQFKRDLKSLGFEVVSLPGPPGKREMTKAIKL